MLLDAVRPPEGNEASCRRFDWSLCCRSTCASRDKKHIDFVWNLITAFRRDCLRVNLSISFMERTMSKLTMTVMGSVFLGLLFGTVCKAEPGTDSSGFTPSQSSAIQRMIEASLGNHLNFIVDKLDDLERRIKADQSWSASRLF